MKYALIGCGRISPNHVAAAIKNNLDIVAVCDIVPEHMENILSKHGLQNNNNIARYTDYKKMLMEHPEIELVAIATSSGIHAEIALYCINSSKNVIIEKPMAMNMKDADEIIKRSKDKGVIVSVSCVIYENKISILIRRI